MKRLITICLVAGLTLIAASSQVNAAYVPDDAYLMSDHWNDLDVYGNYAANNGTLNSKTDIPGPGVIYNVTLTGTGWADMQIGDGFDNPSNNSGLGTGFTTNMGSGFATAGYDKYSLVIHNPSPSIGFLAGLYMNTGWTDSPWSQTDRYYQDKTDLTWVGPASSVLLTLDFNNAAWWDGDSMEAGYTLLNQDYVSNIGIKIGANLGNPTGAAGSVFDVILLVPEPATMTLLGLGMLTLLRKRRV